MHRLSTVLFLLAPITALAQSPATIRNESNASTVVLRNIPVGAGCPIGFRANRESTAQILTAGTAQKKEPALGLHLSLDRQTSPAIESIEVTVYGVSSKGRILPTDLLTSQNNTSDTVSKSFELQLGPNSEKLAYADVWMSQVGALRWVDLNEIRYADGAVWHSLGSAECRAVPSDFVLVGRR
ncbi:hypothetical protein [Tunturiibacter gelidoferens]|uniref:Uncharacterized protein n=1 Tax=Tunturiibacter gelidiferens TaxID=3069689 RepID=A0ACC5P0Y0_9BACT|nr:hypothetical protein [Edaphobacter lichenicola]MBB5340497.1 hypothetical protein [Edaphobacter lichenicola]